jgi:hypothetical protein
MLFYTCDPGIRSVKCYRLALLSLSVLFELSSLRTMIGGLLWLFYKRCICTLYSLLFLYNRLLYSQVLHRIHIEGCSDIYELCDYTESIESTV